MGLISNLLGDMKKKRAKILILGASGAGKTTFALYLESGSTVTENPDTTLGVDIRKKTVVIDNWTIKQMEIGGAQLYQHAFWKLGLANNDAVIYLIDGTIRPNSNSDAYEMSVLTFDLMLELILPNKIIEVLINKQDLKDSNPLSIEEAFDLYPLNKLKERGANAGLFPTSAKFGHGIKDAIGWLVDTMNKKLIK